MALFDDLLPASLGGVPFLTPGGLNTTGGRKTIVHEFPNSSRRQIEDLGLLNDQFSINATITEPNYLQKRNALKTVLDRPGPYILVHPTFGTRNVKQTAPYTISESESELGIARFTITLAVDQPAIFPTPTSGSLSNIFNSVNQAITLVNTGIIQLISLTRSSNFLEALDKLNSFIDTIDVLTTKFISNSELTDDFTTTIDNFRENTSIILSDAVTLGNTIVETFTTLDDALATPGQAKSLFEGLYSFGEDDIPITPTTFELQERLGNNNILNGSIRTLALLMNYRNVPQINFLTVDEIDVARQELDDQFNVIFQNPRVNKSDTTSLQSARNFVREFFDNAALNAFKIGDFNTNDTTITNMTFQLYGDLDNTENLIKLNNLLDITHVEGDLKILTR